MRIWNKWCFTISAACLLTGLTVTSAALAAPARQTAAVVQTRTDPTLGTILVNSQGLSLYVLSSETAANLRCSGGCLNFWPPLTVPAGTTSPTAGAGVSGTLGMITRPDGTNQVTFNGAPLYTFAADKAAGDLHGQGIQAFGGQWHVVLASVPLTAMATEPLLVKITATNATIWGTVTIRYVFQHRSVQKLCGQTSCQFSVPYGVRVKLSERAIDATSRPFKAWQVRGLTAHAQPSNSSASQVSLRMTSSYRVKAIYASGYQR